MSAQPRRPRVVVCIPAYNEENSIAKIIVSAKRHADFVIVCDDGSSDMTREIAEGLGVRVIGHSTNMGKGETLRSLIEEAMKLNPAAVVTIDADGQHDADEIPAVVRPILNHEADIVVGVRTMQSGSVPRERIVGNKLLDAMVSAKAGKGLHDTQSGFRAYSPDALAKIDFSQHGMAVESQTLIDAVASGVKTVEVPISVKYEGIPSKRNPAKHLSEVVDYLLTSTIVNSPLLYLGLPGLAAMILGIAAGLLVVSIFATTHQIAVGTALVGVILVIVGTVALATALIVKLLTARTQARD